MTERRAPDDRLWYLAGPMSHIPQFNYPTFFRVAKALRAEGYNVLSPAEQDSPEQLEIILASPDGNIGAIDKEVGTWGDFLSHDVKLIADKVGGIVFLPGWQQSRGARLEGYVGLTCGHPFMEVNFYGHGPEQQLLLSDLSPDRVKQEIFNHV